MWYTVSMRVGEKKHSGFTIVELLIVIVVIAILAAITIVSYNGITASTNDSAVQSDLSTISKKIQMYKITSAQGVYPLATVGELTAALDGYKVSRAAYGRNYDNGTTQYNLIYCYNNDRSSYGLAAWSKSGQGFFVKDGVVQKTSVAPGNSSTICPQLTSPWTSGQMLWLYDTATGAVGWRTFV